MNRTSAISLVALLALGATVFAQPNDLDWATAPSVQIATSDVLSDEDLALVAGGLGGLETDACVTAVVAASTTMKFGGAYLSIGNPIMGLAIVGLGVATSALIAFC